MTSPTTVVIAIGNSDDKLTQAEWAQYQARVHRFVEVAATTIHGRWTSLPDAPWQNAAWSFSLDEKTTVGSGLAALQGTPDDRPAREWLRGELVALARHFKQDAIAWTEGTTTFLPEPSPDPVLSGPPGKIPALFSTVVPAGGILRKPETWCQIYGGITVKDADGWRREDGVTWETPITERTFLERLGQSTHEAWIDPAQHNPWDILCAKNRQGEPTHRSAKCPVCQPAAYERNNLS